jgi:acyl carrier protein
MGSKLSRDELTHLVLDVLSEILDSRGFEVQEDLGPETVLLGRSAVVDSLGLVSIAMEVEQRLLDDHRLKVSLTGEKAMAAEASPYRSVSSLVDFAAAELVAVGVAVS